jgi:hypothetical protein
VVRDGTSKGSTISLWLQYIRGHYLPGPYRKKKKKKDRRENKSPLETNNEISCDFVEWSDLAQYTKI